MKKITPILLAASILVVSASPTFAATAGSDTKDIRVGGHVSPASCDISIDNGGNFDYGQLTADKLNTDKGQSTILGSMKNSFSIVCAGKTLIALTSFDGKPTSVNPGNLLGQISPLHRFGLGAASNGAQIGAYAISVDNVTLDGTPAHHLIWADKSTAPTWNPRGPGTPDYLLNNGQRLNSWSPNTSNVPGKATTITGTFTVQAGLMPQSSLPSDYSFSGVATVELNYL